MRCQVTISAVKPPDLSVGSVNIKLESIGDTMDYG